LTKKRSKSRKNKIVQERPTFLGDMKNLFNGVRKVISNSDISFKVNNIEVNKDKQNNMKFSMLKENLRTNVHVKNTGAISIESHSMENDIGAISTGTNTRE